MEAPGRLAAAVGRRTKQTYSPELRRRIMSYVRDGRNRGDSWTQIIEQLGVPESTVQRWRAAEEPVSIVPVRTVAPVVDVVAAASATRLSIMSPGGWRIVDLTVSEAAQLLRELER
jgi:transposase-like protein